MITPSTYRNQPQYLDSGKHAFDIFFFFSYYYYITSESSMHNKIYKELYFHEFCSDQLKIQFNGKVLKGYTVK